MSKPRKTPEAPSVRSANEAIAELAAVLEGAKSALGTLKRLGHTAVPFVTLEDFYRRVRRAAKPLLQLRAAREARVAKRRKELREALANARADGIASARAAATVGRRPKGKGK